MDNVFFESGSFESKNVHDFSLLFNLDFLDENSNSDRFEHLKYLTLVDRVVPDSPDSTTRYETDKKLLIIYLLVAGILWLALDSFSLKPAHKYATEKSVTIEVELLPAAVSVVSSNQPEKTGYVLEEPTVSETAQPLAGKMELVPSLDDVSSPVNSQNNSADVPDAPTFSILTMVEDYPIDEFIQNSRADHSSGDVRETLRSRGTVFNEAFQQQLDSEFVTKLNRRNSAPTENVNISEATSLVQIGDRCALVTDNGSHTLPTIDSGKGLFRNVDLCRRLAAPTRIMRDMVKVEEVIKSEE